MLRASNYSSQHCQMMKCFIIECGTEEQDEMYPCLSNLHKHHFLIFLSVAGSNSFFHSQFLSRLLCPLSLWASKEWITVAGCPCPCHFTSSLLPLLFIPPIPASCISHSLYVSLALFVCLALIALLSRWYRIQFHKFIVLVKNLCPHICECEWMEGASL